jgi:hypothetical protein
MSATRAGRGAMAPLLVRPAELATDPVTTAVMPGQPESDGIADFLASAAERVSRLVIEGEPGIGKTTLVGRDRAGAVPASYAARDSRADDAPGAPAGFSPPVIQSPMGPVHQQPLSPPVHQQPLSPPVIQGPAGPGIVQAPSGQTPGGHQTGPI